MKKPSVLSLITPTLGIFLATMILANIAGQMYAPLFSLYLQSLGANIDQIGLFFTISMLIPLAFQILGGWLSDSLGRLQAIGIGSLAGLFGYLLLWISPSWEWLLLAQIGTSMAGSFVGPSFQAFVAEESKSENLGRVYGITNALFAVVGVIGPVLGGLLSDKWGYKPMLLVAFILYAMATVIRLAMALKDRKKHAEAVENGVAEKRKATWVGLKKNIGAMLAMLVGGGIVTWMFICDGSRDIAFNMAGQFIPLYMQNNIGLTNSQIGILNSLSAVASMALMVPGGWVSDKKGERVGIVAGFGMICIGFATFILSHSFALFLVSFILLGIGDAFIGPAYSALIAKVVPQEVRGTAFGVFTTSLGIISLPAPYIGGLLYSRIGPLLTFTIPLVVMTLLLPVMWIKFKLPKTTPAQPAAEAAGVPAE
jgi:MFS family permease